MDFTIWTDGGCAQNPGGPGGIGVVIVNEKDGSIRELSQGYAATTNNRMEIRAVLAALAEVPAGCSVQLFSDSQYVVNCMKGIWKKKKNQDLWVLMQRAAAGKDIHPEWVKGHDGNFFNERCDKLASHAIKDTAGHIPDEGYLEEAPLPSPEAAYEKYKLHWMISHGFTLTDLKNAVVEAMEDMAEDGEVIKEKADVAPFVEGAIDAFLDRGFGSGSLYACFEEFLGAEYRDRDYIRYLESL